jgi:transposase
LFFDARRLNLRRIVAVGPALTVVLQSTAATAACPLCGQSSTRPHSRYVRKLADLPCHDQPVRIHLEVRRFFCSSTDCPRRIFAEQMPALAAARARTTVRLHKAHGDIGLALGGEAGARLAGRLHMATSPDTLLRRVRQAPLPAQPVPRVLGVDDWAWRKGHHYGTILCDLKRHRPVDLLPDRKADTLAEWLKSHPGVEIVSRDRAGAYAQGTRVGAPAAIQVADRWHLLKNVREALERLLGRKRRDLNAAAAAVADVTTTPSVGDATATAAAATEPLATERPPRKEVARQARRGRRLERYQRVVELHRQGVSQRAIARQTGQNRATVARFVHAPDFPEHVSRRRRLGPHPVDRCIDYIRQRQTDGCHNLKRITQELVAKGHRVSYHQVRRYLDSRCPQVVPPQSLPPPPPSPRQVSWLLLRPAAEVPAKDKPFVEALCRGSAEIEGAARHVRAFGDLVRRQGSATLEDWLRQAESEALPTEVRNLAASLRQDQAAVQAALDLPWSNGPVEGEVNRLKVLKRQMYNRAGLDLLRQRVLRKEG